MEKSGLMSWKILEHTSDLWIEAENDSFESALEDLAKGMFEHMGGKNAGSEIMEFEKKAGNMEELVVELLSDILAECEIRDFVPASLKVVKYVKNEIKVEVKGRKDTLENIIKGVTYHDLEIENKNGKWKIRVLFDI